MRVCESCCNCEDLLVFKQKTAYEMRISDWSSDVSAAERAARQPGRHQQRRGEVDHHRHAAADQDVGAVKVVVGDAGGVQGGDGGPQLPEDLVRHHRHVVRSEEHTSELQSLMRISYAVFCLNKKNK